MKRAGRYSDRYFTPEQRAYARAQLRALLPFEVWKARRNPTPFQESLYHDVVANLRAIADGEPPHTGTNNAHR